MFSFLCKNSIPMNPKMREYCIKSTNDSIRKMTEKYNEERKMNKNKFDNLIVITKDDPPNPNDIGSITEYFERSRDKINIYDRCVCEYSSFNCV